MRVTLATTAPDVGGVTRHVLDLALGLRRRGHAVAVASRADAGPVISAVRTASLPWIPLARSVTAPAEVWHLHLHNTLDTRGPALMNARRIFAAGAIVLTEHLPRVPRTDQRFPSELPLHAQRGRRKPGAAQLKSALKRAELGAADALVTVSGSSADFFARRWQIDRSRVSTIYNGVAVPAQAPSPRREGDVRVVGIAALHWLKGFDVLLEAAARAREPWRVRLVGDGVERARLERQAATLADSRRVEFTGWRDDASLAPLEGDLVCAPSRAESFSYVVLEAMACARPLVASAVDGAAEAVVDGQTGLLVAPDDPVALAQAIDALTRDPERRALMGRAAHARAAAQFGIDDMVDATTELYERVRRGGRRAHQSHGRLVRRSTPTGAATQDRRL